MSHAKPGPEGLTEVQLRILRAFDSAHFAVLLRGPRSATGNSKQRYILYTATGAVCGVLRADYGSPLSGLPARCKGDVEALQRVTRAANMLAAAPRFVVKARELRDLEKLGKILQA